MKFEEALELMRLGKVVRRKSWHKNVKYFFRNNEFFLEGDYFKESVKLPYEETIAEDWEEYKEKSEENK